MSDSLYFPEEYPLLSRDGSVFRLMVNTDTDHWWFRVEVHGTPVGEACCIQRGEELEMRNFHIFDAVPRKDRLIRATWRKLTGAPSHTSYRTMGLGTALLQFISRRALDFIATRILINLDRGPAVQEASRQWLVRRGFKISNEKGFTIACLVLVNETEVPPSEPTPHPLTPAKRSRSQVPRRRGSHQRVVHARKGQTDTDFSKEALSVLFRPLADFLNRKNRDFGDVLDPDVHENLRASRVFVRHGGDTRVLQFHIWHRYQPTIFHPKHYKYEVQYDPYGTMAGSPTENFSIALHVNKTRVYHERAAVLERFRNHLKRLRIPGFRFNENHICIEFNHRFYARTHAAVMREMTKYLFPLLNAVHPIYSEIMDSFNVELTKEQRRAVIAGRKGAPTLRVGRRNPRRNREYCREVPPRLRNQVFRRDNYVCQACWRKFSAAKLHADHINPVALGGLTTLANLQTLCGPCNLKKGKGLTDS